MLNALTALLCVIFLQVLMFVKNAVPMTNGILMSQGSSITYFIMSLVTLLYLYACHEAASYMLLKYHFAFTLLYGLVVLTLGILCFIFDYGGASQDSKAIWGTMSNNQQAFFDNKQDNLIAERQNNTFLASLFGTILGLLIIIQAGLVMTLRTQRDEIEDQNIEWAPTQLKSRYINKVLAHEQSKFPYIKKNDDPQLSLILGLKKKKTRTGIAGMEESEEQIDDEYNYNEKFDEMDYDIVSEPDPNQLPVGEQSYNEDKFDEESNRGGYDRYERGNDRSYSRRGR